MMAKNAITFENLNDMESDEVFDLIDGITDEQVYNSDIGGDSHADDAIADSSFLYRLQVPLFQLILIIIRFLHISDDNNNRPILRQTVQNNTHDKTLDKTNFTDVKLAASSSRSRSGVG